MRQPLGTTVSYVPGGDGGAFLTPPVGTRTMLGHGTVPNEANQAGCKEPGIINWPQESPKGELLFPS